MTKFAGATRYTQSLTRNEEEFAQAVASGLNKSEAYRIAYNDEVEKNNLSNEVINVRAGRTYKKEKVKLRVDELINLKKLEVQFDETGADPIEIIKSNPKNFIINELYSFIKECKYTDDRSNRLKAIDSIAKIFNLYNENGAINNTQLNNIVVNSVNIEDAINSIHQLVNKL